MAFTNEEIMRMTELALRQHNVVVRQVGTDNATIVLRQPTYSNGVIAPTGNETNDPTQNLSVSITYTIS